MKKVVVFLIGLIIITPVKADFISLIRADKSETIIEIYIEEDQIRIDRMLTQKKIILDA